MKPNFALTLSFDGIALLHRSPSGWTVVGEVPLDAADLVAGLAAMRATAVGLEPGGLRTKVMLPADQVKLLDAAEPGEAAARAVLEGATPYPAADLVMDHAAMGGRNRVAAVARETLEEAEAFAAGHRFHPVCFAATLADDAFPTEAFFGESAHARAGTERVERDEGPTRPTARLPAPAGEAVAFEAGPEAQIATPTADEAAPPDVGPPADEPSQADPVDPSEDVVAASEHEHAQPVDVPPAVEASPADAPVLNLDPSATEPDDGAPEPTAPAEAPLSATGIPEPAFASRSRLQPGPESVGPVLVGATRVPLRAPARSASAQAGEGKARGPGRAEPPVRRAAFAPQAGQLLRAPPPPAAARAIAGTTAAAMATVVALAPASAAAAPAQQPDPPGPSPRRAATVAEPRLAGETLRPRGRPRFLALSLTAALLLALMAVGLWASVTDRTLAGIFGAPSPVEVAATSPTVAADPSPEPSAEAVTATPPTPAAVDAAESARAAAAVAAAIEALPEAAAPVGAPVSPAEAERIYAATGVWLRAPSLPDLPRAEPAPAWAAAAVDAARPATAALAPLSVAAADPVPEAPTPSPGPGAAAPPPVGLVAATPEGALAPSGVLIVAGAPPRLPPSRPAAIEAAQPVEAAADGTVNAMAEAPSVRPAPRPADPVLPEFMRLAAADAAPPLGAPLGEPGGAAGSVAAEGLAQLAATPDALAFTEASAAPGAVGLAAFEGARPLARPADLAPAAPVVLASFDGPRPGPRPAGLAPEPEPEEPAVAEAAPPGDPAAVEAALAAAQAATAPSAESAAPQPDVQTALASIVAGAPDPLAGATRQAVAQATRPGPRPRSFDRVVRDQLARSARAAQPATAPAAAAPSGNSPEDVESSDPEVASAAAAAPSGPTAASVAQAATFSDVMALREINLIGVFGQPSDRHALVRMGNGRYLRVGVGDSLDGGQVTAIGDNALNYTKRGRQLQLVIPGG